MVDHEQSTPLMTKSDLNFLKYLETRDVDEKDNIMFEDLEDLPELFAKRDALFELLKQHELDFEEEKLKAGFHPKQPKKQKQPPQKNDENDENDDVLPKNIGTKRDNTKEDGANTASYPKKKQKVNKKEGIINEETSGENLDFSDHENNENNSDQTDENEINGGDNTHKEHTSKPKKTFAERRRAGEIDKFGVPRKLTLKNARIQAKRVNLDRLKQVDTKKARGHVNNMALLEKKLNEIKQDLPWEERLLLETEIGEVQVVDDPEIVLQRELVFLRRSP